jgi:phosphoglycerate dehydrogenase-like enzyme
VIAVLDREFVTVLGEIDEAERDRIRAAASLARIEFVSVLEGVPDWLDQVTVIAGHPTPAQLSAAVRLRWIHSWAAGVDALLSPPMRASPVTLTSSAGNGAIPLAEHAMMLMLMLNRDAPRWWRAQGERVWDRFEHAELSGLTCGLLGLGNAGTELAVRARAFGMQVVGLRRSPGRPVPGVDRVYGLDQLHTFLGMSDVVVVTLPRTAATANLLGAREFAAMKRSAHLICLSRGGIVDDDALLAALEAGEIAGAGLDAHGVEPLPAGSPFWTLPNVIVTPHNGATTPQTRKRGVDIFIANLQRHLAGRPLMNVVDKAAGY